MAKQYKTVHKIYTAWDYKREIEDMNKLSEEGWQLVEGRSFGSRFEKNPNLRYRYQLDFRKVSDLPRYIETFREQGWEYVNSTFNDWHYFRKLYDPSLPEEEYEILTDTESMQEMTGRWIRIGIAGLVIMGIVAVPEAVYLVLWPSLPLLLRLAAFLLLLCFLGRGVYLMRRPEKKPRRKSLFLVPFLLFAVLYGGSIALEVFRPETSWRSSAAYYNPIPAELSQAVQLNSFTVNYPDSYPLRVKINAASPMTVTIRSGEGETVYTLTGSDVSDAKRWFPLSPGRYSVWLSDFEGGAMDVDFRMR